MRNNRQNKDLLCMATTDLVLAKFKFLLWDIIYQYYMENAAQTPNIHSDQAALIALALTKIKSILDLAQERRVHWRTYHEQLRLNKRECEAKWNEQAQAQIEDRLQQARLSDEEKMKRNLLNWVLRNLGVSGKVREETYVHAM